jgi:hypothetical protein
LALIGSAAGHWPYRGRLRRTRRTLTGCSALGRNCAKIGPMHLLGEQIPSSRSQDGLLVFLCRSYASLLSGHSALSGRRLKTRQILRRLRNTNQSRSVRSARRPRPRTLSNGFSGLLRLAAGFRRTWSAIRALTPRIYAVTRHFAPPDRGLPLGLNCQLVGLPGAHSTL